SSAFIKKKTAPEGAAPDPVRGFASLKQSIRAHEYRGQRLRISCYAKIFGDEQRGLRKNGSRFPEEIWLWAAFNESPRYIPASGVASVPLDRTDEWTQYEVVVQVPQGATTILFGIDFLGGPASHGWFDDFEINVLANADTSPV